MSKVPVWDIYINLGEATYKLLTTDEQYLYDAFDNKELKDPAGYIEDESKQ